MARFDVEAVLFDLDGTLLDTLPDLFNAANAMLAELGHAPRSLEDIRCFIGKGMPNLVMRCLTEGRVAAEGAVDAALPVYKRHYAAINGDAARIYDGVEPTLVALAKQGIKLACVTNKPADFTVPLLERVGLAHYFGAIIGGDSLPQKKPHPAPLLRACELLGVSPADALMVGDSANDAEAAQAAGMPALLMTYGYSEGRPVDTIECDGLVSAFPELLRHIGRASAAT